MFILRIAFNALILALELALIGAVAWLGWRYPVAFAIASGLLGFVLGFGLERARLSNELTFYMGGVARPLSLFTGGVALGEALVKGLLAGIAALLTFSGTDSHRLALVAAVFAICLFAGTSLLRRLRLSLGVRADRWGYFRLAAPLGLIFSAGLAGLVYAKLISAASLADLARRLVIDTPQRPTIPQASELLFLFKQYFDEVIVSLLTVVLGREWASLVGIVISVNMLTGFVVAVYAVIIAEIVRRLERLGR